MHQTQKIFSGTPINPELKSTIEIQIIKRFCGALRNFEFLSITIKTREFPKTLMKRRTISTKIRKISKRFKSMAALHQVSLVYEYQLEVKKR
jgi:hypothetical protein